MSMMKKTMEENYLFFARELARIDAEINALPKGSISAKKIGGKTYSYRQWRDGDRVKSVSVGTSPPADLVHRIKERKLLEAQRREIRENLNVLAKAVDARRATVDEILRILSRNAIHATLIGSYCMPLYKEKWGMNLPTIRTQDVDFLVPSPYRGKEADVEKILSDVGFSIGFYPDGSNYFTNGVFKVEFLVSKKGKGSDDVVYVKALKVKAISLRYLQMLIDNQVSLKMDGYSVLLPKPWVFAFHKILIIETRKLESKKEKDMLQALSILREVMKQPSDWNKSLSYLKTIPASWAKRIRAVIAERLLDFLPA